MSVPADRMRRRTSTVPTLEDLEAAQNAPAAPTRGFLRQSVDEVRSAARDAVRDPLDAIGRATAPLPGVGGSVARLGGLLRGGGTAVGSAAAGNLAAGSTLAAVVPSVAVQARNEALSSGVTPSARRAGARRRGGAPMAGSLDGTRQVQTAPDAADTDYTFGPERVSTQQVEAPTLRGRQGAIIANPGAMSVTDRLRGLMSEFKGSPSLRRLAAEQIIGEAQAREDNFQGAQAENAAADRAQADMTMRSREAYADRRLRADMSNQDASQRSLNSDREYELGRADRQLQAAELAIARRAAEAKLGTATTANKRTDDLVAAELERDPTLTREQAIIRANAIATLEGEDTQASATGRAGDALAANALDSAIQRRVPGNPFSRGVDAASRGVMNLFGSDLSAADDQVLRGETSPDAYDARGLTWRERLQSTLLPGRSASDVVLTDRNGRNVQVDSAALGGLTTEEYNRRALLRRSTTE